MTMMAKLTDGVDLPGKREFGGTYNVRLKPGQVVELPNYQGDDKYVWVIRRL